MAKLIDEKRYCVHIEYADMNNIIITNGVLRKHNFK